MKLYLSGFILLVSIIYFSSCQKEITRDTPQTPQPPPNDSIYLDKSFGLDTTLPAGSDTTDKVFFTYDNSKRLSTMTQLYGTGFTGSSTFTFHYNGNDSLPWKQVDREASPGGYVYVDTIYYFYSNAIVSRDSVITWDDVANIIVGANVTSYIVSGNSVNRTNKHYDYTGGNYVLTYTAVSTLNVTSTSGNITTQTLVSGNNAFQSVQASYDNKPNPLSRVLKVKYPELDTYYWLSWLVQRNNPAQVQYQEMGFPAETEVYNYVYRSDGYPLRFTFSSTAGSNAANKILFFYKAL